MWKSEFSINFSTPTLKANCWCLWTKTTLQLRLRSRFMYLYAFKHSLEVYTSWVASFNHFNHSNPDRYHCTCSAVFYHTGEAGMTPRNNQPNPIKFLAFPSYFHIPLPWPGPDKHCGTPPHGLTFPFSLADNANTGVLLRQVSMKQCWAIVLLGSAVSDLLV